MLGLRWRWAALLRWAALACCAGPALALACAGAELRCALACAALGFLDLRWRWAALRWPALAALDKQNKTKTKTNVPFSVSLHEEPRSPARQCSGSELRCAQGCAGDPALGLRWRWAALALGCAAALGCAGDSALGLRWRWAALALGCAGADQILRWLALGRHLRWAALALGCAVR